MPNRIVTSKVKKISVEDRKEGKLIKGILNIKSKFIYQKIAPYINGPRVLDIGTGIGGFAYYLHTKGYEITSIDVDNSSYFQEYPTTIYDGRNFPFDEQEFDTALLIHVLHHCSDRIQVLREALRVAKRVIFIEDTYRNKLEKIIVSANDMIGNGEFYPHLYSTPEEWRTILKREGCDTIFEQAYSRFTYHIFYGRYVLFVIERSR